MGRIKVVDQKVERYVRFDTFEVGETFRSDGQIYVKFNSSNAFSFQENRVFCFDSDAPVVRVNCKLVVEG